MGETEEEIEFFCVHDLDAPGTMIYRTLQEETRARKARKVKIIDLGLTYEDTKKMGLQIEKVYYKKEQAVADKYIEHKAWLQHNSVELNAMDTPTFINWITGKIKEYGKGKLIPPQNVLFNEAISKAEMKLRGRIRAKIEAEIKIEALIEKEFNKHFPGMVANIKEIDLLEEVKKGFSYNPAYSWREPINNKVIKIVTGKRIN